MLSWGGTGFVCCAGSAAGSNPISNANKREGRCMGLTDTWGSVWGVVGSGRDIARAFVVDS